MAQVGISRSARVGCRVQLATDEDNDMGCDSVTAYIDDVSFAVLWAEDSSARAQLLTLADMFNRALHQVSVKLAELGPES